MEKSARSFVVGQKVKLKLSQPRIMCSGRAPVECYHRGKITDILDGVLVIAFKQYGDFREAEYDYTISEFIEEDLKDLVLL